MRRVAQCPTDATSREVHPDARRKFDGTTKAKTHVIIPGSDVCFGKAENNLHSPLLDSLPSFARSVFEYLVVCGERACFVPFLAGEYTGATSRVGRAVGLFAA